MNYVYTQVEIQPVGWEPRGITKRGYVFDIVAEDTAKLDEAISDAEGLVQISEMEPKDAPWPERRPPEVEVKWSGENEIPESHLEELIQRRQTDDYHYEVSQHHVDQVFSDLGRKGWVYLTRP